MERLQTSNVSISNGNIKCPRSKNEFSFAVNLPFNGASYANAYTGSPKFLHIVICYEFETELHADEILTKSYGPNYTKFELLIKAIFDKILTPFWKSFLQLKQLFFQITIFLCSKNGKNYSPTPATRSKTAPNMTDPHSMKVAFTHWRNIMFSDNIQ